MYLKQVKDVLTLYGGLIILKVILGRVPTRYVEDKIYGLEHVEQYLKEDKAV